MKHRLLARKDEHWEVWTNWYDARLDPLKNIPCYSPPIKELERARVLLPKDLWEEGPAAVNAAIKRLIEEHDCNKEEGEGLEELKQIPAPYVFEEDEQGRIIARPYEGPIHEPELAEQLRSAMKETALQLIKRLRSTQAPERVRQTVQRLIDILGDRLDDVRAGDLLMASRSLEADLDAYDSESGRLELSEDGYSGLRELALLAGDLRAQFQAISDMLARAQTQQVLEAGIDNVLAESDKIVEGFAGLDEAIVAKDSALPALRSADRDIEETKADLEVAPEHKRGEIRQKLAALASLKLQILQNAVSRLLKKAEPYYVAALEDFDDNHAKSLQNAGKIAAAVGGSLFFAGSPIWAGVAGLSAFGFSYWRFLKKRADELKQR